MRAMGPMGAGVVAMCVSAVLLGAACDDAATPFGTGTTTTAIDGAIDGATDGTTDLPSAPTSDPGQGTLPVGQGRRVVVERVIDGDTIVVSGGERVRLIGIDTPETVKPGSPVECFGREASRRLDELLPAGTDVLLVADVDARDRYDRTLSYVYRENDGLFVNASLVGDGYAYAYTVPPNVAHAEEFAALQGEAQASDRGLWSACPVP
jgi:micrococcal nuclease